jgi:hypothetical protein
MYPIFRRLVLKYHLCRPLDPKDRDILQWPLDIEGSLGLYPQLAL